MDMLVAGISWCVHFWIILRYCGVSSSCIYNNNVCFEAVNSSYYVDDEVMSNSYNRKLSIRLANGDVRVLGGIGGSVGYLFEQDREFSGVPLEAIPSNLCESPTNGAQFPGKVVIAARGDCSFDVKSVFALTNGARAVVILTDVTDILASQGVDACIDASYVKDESFATILITDTDKVEYINRYIGDTDTISFTVSGAGESLGGSCKFEMCFGGIWSHTCARSGKKCQCNDIAFSEVTVDGKQVCQKLPSVDAHSAVRSGFCLEERWTFEFPTHTEDPSEMGDNTNEGTYELSSTSTSDQSGAGPTESTQSNPGDASNTSTPQVPISKQTDMEPTTSTIEHSNTQPSSQICELPIKNQQWCRSVGTEEAADTIPVPLQLDTIQSLQICLTQCLDLPLCCGLFFHRVFGSCDIISVDQPISVDDHTDNWMFCS